MNSKAIKIIFAVVTLGFILSPILSESQKINDTGANYTIQELERINVQLKIQRQMYENK